MLCGSLGENGYMYMYGWVSLLSTWNYHNTVNPLWYKIKSQKEKKKNGRPYNLKTLKNKYVKTNINLMKSIEYV